jgi:hypothetical protein
MKSVAQISKEFYDYELRSRLEADYRDEYVAIEPLSRSYFVGNTFIAAALAARKAYPDRKSFVIRIGHDVAFHIGAIASRHPSSV